MVVPLFWNVKAIFGVKQRVQQVSCCGDVVRTFLASELILSAVPQRFCALDWR